MTQSTRERALEAALRNYMAADDMSMSTRGVRSSAESALALPSSPPDDAPALGSEGEGVMPHAGQWTLGNGYKIARDHAICDGPFIVAKVNGQGYPCGEGWHPQSALYARLIAAAPDMLAALQSAERILTDVSANAIRNAGVPDKVLMERAQVLDTARAALARATGKEG